MKQLMTISQKIAEEKNARARGTDEIYVIARAMKTS